MGAQPRQRDPAEAATLDVDRLARRIGDVVADTIRAELAPGVRVEDGSDAQWITGQPDEIPLDVDKVAVGGQVAFVIVNGRPHYHVSIDDGPVIDLRDGPVFVSLGQTIRAVQP